MLSTIVFNSFLMLQLCDYTSSVEEEERMIGFALFSHVANVLWLQSSTKNIKKCINATWQFLFVCSYKINCIRFRSLYIINLVQQPRFFHSKWTKRQETDHENQIKVCKVLIWSHFWFYYASLALCTSSLNVFRWASHKVKKNI